MDSDQSDFRPLGCMMKFALALVVVVLFIIFFLGIMAGLVLATTL